MFRNGKTTLCGLISSSRYLWRSRNATLPKSSSVKSAFRPGEISALRTIRDFSLSVLTSNPTADTTSAAEIALVSPFGETAPCSEIMRRGFS